MRLNFLILTLTGLLALGALRFGEYLYTLLTVAFLLLGLTMVYGLVCRQRIYVASLLVTNLIFVAFGTWVFNIRELVADTLLFDFSVFTDSNLRTALAVLMASSVAVCIPPILTRSGAGPLVLESPRRIMESWLHTFSRVDALAGYALVLGATLFALLLFLTNPTILDKPYPEQFDDQWFAPPLLIFVLGASIIGSLVAYARCLELRGGRMLLLVARTAGLLCALMLLALSGGRGLFVLSWLLLALIELFLLRTIPGSRVWVIIYLGLAVAALALWPSMRATLALIPPTEALTEALRGLSTMFSPSGTTGSLIDIDSIPVLNMAFFQLLYAIQLVSDGLSLKGSTFLNLIPQALPSFLDGVFWDRPIHDAFHLSDYYTHTGGFLVVGNAYWNGGFWVAVLYFLFLSTVSNTIDGHYESANSGLIYRIGYLLSLPLFAVTLAYGIQSNARALQLVAVMALSDYAWKWLKSQN